MSFGDRVLDWVLRHGRAAGAPEERDLVLVHDHPGLEELSPSATLSGQPWRIARVTGELTLRDALYEAGRLVAVVPGTFQPPLDLIGRAWLSRQVSVQPRDLIAALTGRPCEPIADPQLASAVEDALPQLKALDGTWSVGGTVGEREIRNVLLGLQLGADHRFDRETPESLLRRWILEGPPTVTSAALLAEALRLEHARHGIWLAWALTEGSVAQLVAAGALAGSEEGSRLAPELPSLSGASDRHRLRSVVEQAVRAAWAQDAEKARAALQEAERLAATLPASLAPDHPLLAGPLERYLQEAAGQAAAGEPEPDARLEALSTHLHLAAQGSAYTLVREISRLARFVGSVEVPMAASLATWASLARTHIAWGDLAFRRARRALGPALPKLTEAASRVMQQFAERRDALNAVFGGWLAERWGEVAGQTDVRAPFALQHLSRLVLRPLLDDGQRVLLVVLDGCDLASFVDLVELSTDEHEVALGLPALNDPDLAGDLSTQGAWRVALAPIPTVTSHARRALFAGDIPHSTALDATEEAAANASNDKKALRDNPALGDTPRALLLKGDVGDLGGAVRAALAGDDRLVAVVLNDVDDALSSKQTTPMPPWSLEALSAGAAGWLTEALDQGWSVVVTADHGHSPYVASDRKLALAGAGGRIASGPGEGVVTLSDGPLPSAPLHLLTGFGAWRGVQRRGWHGGASLEEVFVPLAFLRRGTVHAEGFSRPSWWSISAEPEEAQQGTSVPETQTAGPSAPPSPEEPPVEVPEAVADALKFFPRGLELVQQVIANNPVDVAAVAYAMDMTQVDVRGLVEIVLDFLRRSESANTVVVDGYLLRWSPVPTGEDWLQRIEDAVDREVLGYLHRHEVIIERDLVELIGNPRRARRFASRVEELSALAPFRIIAEPLDDGSKRYSIVKD